MLEIVRMDGYGMKVTLSLDAIRTSMALWRDALDMRMPMHDDFKLHFMQQRVPILQRYKSTSAAWLMVLREAVPDASSKADFDTGVAEIADFNAWATAELERLSALAVSEEVQTGLDQLLADPTMTDVVNRLAKHFQQRREDPKPE